MTNFDKIHFSEWFWFVDVHKSLEWVTNNRESKEKGSKNTMYMECISRRHLIKTF